MHIDVILKCRVKVEIRSSIYEIKQNSSLFHGNDHKQKIFGSKLTKENLH